MADVEGMVNPSYKKEGDNDSWPEDDQGNKVTTDTTAIAVEMDKTVSPSAPGAEEDNEEELEVESGRYTADEEKILDVLREVVRKCTNPDPMKRPTAAEVLEMLNKCPVNVK